MNKKISTCLAACLLALAQSASAADDGVVTISADSVASAELDVNADGHFCHGGRINPDATFTDGQGTAVKVAISHFYFSYQALTSRSALTTDDVDYKTYSAGIDLRDDNLPYWRFGWVKPYYDIAFGLGHAETRVDAGDTSQDSFAEVRGSLGFVFFRRLSVGVGGSFQVLGYPGKTIATSSNPSLTAALWF